MRQIGKRILLITSIIALAGAVIFSMAIREQKNKGSKVETKKVRIAYLPIAQGLPFYLALEKGYFAEAGLEVEPKRIDSPQLIFDTLLADQTDFGAPSTAAGISGITEYRRPGSLKIFALVGDDDTATNYCLLVANGSNLKTINDLAGKKLGIIPGIQFRTLAKEILAKNNLSDRDIALVEIASGIQIQALSSHQIDALLTLEPNRAIAETKGIGHELVVAPALTYIANPFYGSAGVVSTKFLNQDPDAARKVIEVFTRAITEISQNPRGAKQYLKKYTSLDDATINSVPLPVFKSYTDFTDKDINALQQWFDVFTKQGVIDGRVDAGSMIYKP